MKSPCTHPDVPRLRSGVHSDSTACSRPLADAGAHHSTTPRLSRCAVHRRAACFPPPCPHSSVMPRPNPLLAQQDGVCLASAAGRNTARTNTLEWNLGNEYGWLKGSLMITFRIHWSCPGKQTRYITYFSDPTARILSVKTAWRKPIYHPGAPATKHHWITFGRKLKQRVCKHKWKKQIYTKVHSYCP